MVFHRYTERAQRTVALAEHEARCLGSGAVGTEHLLLALLRDPHSMAVKALVDMDITLNHLEEGVMGLIHRGQLAENGDLRFTARARQVVSELALVEAETLGHERVGPEHILLGLIREGEGIAAIVLDRMGVMLKVVRRSVRRLASDDVESLADTDLTNDVSDPGHELERVLRVARRAKEEAKGLSCSNLGYEHLIMAILADPEAADVADLLKARGITLQWLRDQYRTG